MTSIIHNRNTRHLISNAKVVILLIFHNFACGNSTACKESRQGRGECHCSSLLFYSLEIDFNSLISGNKWLINPKKALWYLNSWMWQKPRWSDSFIIRKNSENILQKIECVGTCFLDDLIYNFLRIKIRLKKTDWVAYNK